MRTTSLSRAALALGALVLGACGATNVNQSNYDAVKKANAPAHDDHGEGGDHGADGDHAKAEGDHAKAEGDHAKAEGDHADGSADAHADGAAGRDLAKGKKVYETYCQSCHGADGKGMNGLAANLADDKTRLAKDTDLLVKHIREGYSGEIGVMPPWGAVVSDSDARDTVAWLREQYPPQ